MSNEFRQVELMIGDVRRRRWTTERKLREGPGAAFRSGTIAASKMGAG
ncbi:hypothetical protein [Sinorhizobium meliloti]|nr:hypothetical protein [Sinorhizobium meliloti]